jgi:CO/xanthine dehydrogenase FAD-binding subunit
MLRFDYLKAVSTDSACDLLRQYNGEARLIAGGTDIMVQIRKDDKRLSDMKYVIDIGDIPELSYVEAQGNTVLIGAGLTHKEACSSALLKQNVPFLVEAVSTIGSPQIRNRGTFAGNICNASPASDLIPVLVALDAKLRLKNMSGERVVEIASIFEKPYKTNLSPDEMIIEISFEKLLPGTGMAFIKLGYRKAVTISRMNIAVCVTMQDGVIADVRISTGSVMPTPGRITSAEQILKGSRPAESLIDNAAKEVSKEMIKRSGYRWSTEYKQPVIEVLTKRALKKALGVE